MAVQISDMDLAIRYVRKLQSCKGRNIEFNLSLKRYKQLILTKRCFYTGVLMNDIEHHPKQLTLDRIDASVGYTDENTVACCLDINRKKSDLTIKEIEKIYLKLKRKGKL